MLANGTLATFSAASDPHLFKAFGVSAGRLGIIVKLKMTIIPQQAISRSKQVEGGQGIFTMAKCVREGAPWSGWEYDLDLEFDRCSRMQAGRGCVVHLPASNPT